jgi:hypothetical protein
MIVPQVGDEVLSGYVIINMHPFQIWSFYMLPNNHILFNLANKLLFYPIENKVLTGKILSMMAYCFITILIFLWVKRQKWSTTIISLLIVLILMSQFSMWAFSFEGRGYEWQAFLGWLGLISIFEYANHQDKKWLQIFEITSIAGFAMVPSYLLIYFPFLLLIVYLFKWQKEIWFGQIRIIGYCFLFYLPALFFSGFDSLADNHYVSSKQNIEDFISSPSPFRSYVDYCYSFFARNPSYFSLVAFSLPIGLLTIRKNGFFRNYGVFYLLLILSNVLLVILIRKNPFHRGLILHFSFILFGFILIIIYTLRKALKSNLLFNMVVISTSTLLTTHLILSNFQHVTYNMYFSDMVDFKNKVCSALMELPANKKIGFSDKSHQWSYLAHKYKIPYNKCINGDEDILVIQEDEKQPDSKIYKLKKKVLDYYIYQKNNTL